MLHSFLANGIICKDMEKIYSSNDWRVLDNKSFYISGSTGMIASYLLILLVYLNEQYGYGIEIYAGVRNMKKAEWRFGQYVAADYFHIIEGDVVNEFPLKVKVNYIIHAMQQVWQVRSIMAECRLKRCRQIQLGHIACWSMQKNMDAKAFCFLVQGQYMGRNYRCMLLMKSFVDNLIFWLLAAYMAKVNVVAKRYVRHIVTSIKFL